MEDPPQGMYNHEALYYIGKSIDVMGKVDAVYFVKDWREARGCRIERKIAEEYGVKILEYDFLDKFKDETTVRTLDKPNNYRQLVEKDENREVKLKWNTTPKPLTPEKIDEIAKIQDKLRKNHTYFMAPIESMRDIPINVNKEG